MSQQKLLKKVIEILVENDIDYMLTGSIVSSLQGEPRATHDIDFVVVIHKSQIKKILDSFSPSEFYSDEKNINEAIKNKDMFNLMSLADGNKMDFWLLTDSPFDKSRFSRRISEDYLDLKIQVSTPEDTIIQKLYWAKLSGGSEKQFTDALRIFEVQYKLLDLKYIDYWIKELEIESLWKEIKEKAKIE